jgi:hypothetical protein
MLENNLVQVNKNQLDKIYKLAKKSIDAMVVMMNNNGVKNEETAEDLAKFSQSADNLIKNKLQTKFYS